MKKVIYTLSNFIVLSILYIFLYYNKYCEEEISIHLMFFILLVANSCIFFFIIPIIEDDIETNKINEMKSRVDEYNREKSTELNDLKKSVYKYKYDAIADIKKLMTEAEIDFPYYASLLADYKNILNERYIWEIQNKARPAIKTAEKMKALSRELRQTRKEKKMLELQQGVYEEAFPWLEEYKIVSKQEIKQIASMGEADSEQENLIHYLSAAEYEKLSNTEKYQLALDRYKKRHKTNWEIGISFERYIGYQYEQKGYKVIYNGAIMGLQDLGRDIIAYNNSEVIVIQCKYWSREKIIREKHIFQLYGTMIMLNYDENPKYKNKNIRGEFITSAALSDEAKFFADKLSISYIENEIFDRDYPCVKCNINSTHDKIYHLPFDQQYDKVQIDPSKGECYVATVAEAETLGFRKAKKWVAENADFY